MFSAPLPRNPSLMYADSRIICIIHKLTDFDLFPHYEQLILYVVYVRIEALL